LGPGANNARSAGADSLGHPDGDLPAGSHIPEVFEGAVIFGDELNERLVFAVLPTGVVDELVEDHDATGLQHIAELHEDRPGRAVEITVNVQESDLRSTMLGGECRQRLFEKSLNECDIIPDRWKLPPDAERACPSSKRPSLRQANEGIKAIPARAGSERREPIDRIPFVDAELEEKPAVGY